MNVICFCWTRLRPRSLQPPGSSIVTGVWEECRVISDAPRLEPKPQAKLVLSRLTIVACIIIGINSIDATTWPYKAVQISIFFIEMAIIRDIVSDFSDEDEIELCGDDEEDDDVEIGSSEVHGVVFVGIVGGVHEFGYLVHWECDSQLSVVHDRHDSHLV
ncbi:hypothetical protein Lal_00049416 [Lupinus albus]|nr:hypothetical protein Lal_00049416 [Lupinus albus]